MRFPGNCDDPLLLKKKRPRKMFTHEEYITLVLQSGQVCSTRILLKMINSVHKIPLL